MRSYMNMLLDIMVVVIVSVYSASGVRFITGAGLYRTAGFTVTPGEIVLVLYYATLLAAIWGLYRHKPDNHVLSGKGSAALAVFGTALGVIM